MKVRELIEALEKMPQDYEVCFTSTHESPYPIDEVKTLEMAHLSRQVNTFFRYSGWTTTFVNLTTDRYSTALDLHREVY